MIIENNNSINRIDRKLSKSIILFNVKINRDCSSASVEEIAGVMGLMAGLVLAVLASKMLTTPLSTLFLALSLH